MSDTPLFFILNAYTTGLQPGVLTYLLSTALLPKYPGIKTARVSASEIGLPVKDSGFILPCGAAGRFEV